MKNEVGTAASRRRSQLVLVAEKQAGGGGLLAGITFKSANERLALTPHDTMLILDET